LKICMVLEGSYPYVPGGVTKWVDELIRSLPEHEFILWTITDKEERFGGFAMELPSNVVEVHENSLESALRLRVRKNPNLKLTAEEGKAISHLIRCADPDWRVILHSFSERDRNPVELFMSKEFLTLLKDFCHEAFPFAGFTDLFWTMRSMFLPLLYLIGRPMPQADMYHSASTGYAGALGALASLRYNKPYIVTEHGIYTREREEEILRADWVVSYFKELWISMFYMYSRLAYQQANKVTSLFNRASLIQQDLGCPVEKCAVIRNGIKVDKLIKIPILHKDGWMDIGAIVRIAPIKDIKSMIYSFSQLKQEVKKARLHILGGVDDEEYYQECLSLIEYLDVRDILMPGFVDTVDYLDKLDFTILTSISEGQPFAVLESMAARRPLVATDVGSCRELIEGEAGDDFGPAGIFVPPMHQAEFLHALIDMCVDGEMRKRMGQAGQQRVKKYYNHENMINSYAKMYEKVVQ